MPAKWNTGGSLLIREGWANSTWTIEWTKLEPFRVSEESGLVVFHTCAFRTRFYLLCGLSYLFFLEKIRCEFLFAQSAFQTCLVALVHCFNIHVYPTKTRFSHHRSIVLKTRREKHHLETRNLETPEVQNSFSHLVGKAETTVTSPCDAIWWRQNKSLVLTSQSLKSEWMDTSTNRFEDICTHMYCGDSKSSTIHLRNRCFPVHWSGWLSPQGAKTPALRDLFLVSENICCHLGGWERSQSVWGPFSFGWIVFALEGDMTTVRIPVLFPWKLISFFNFFLDYFLCLTYCAM